MVRLAQDIIILTARLLILIGEGVLLIFSVFWKIIKALPKLFLFAKDIVFSSPFRIKSNLKKLLRKNVIEKEIFSADKNSSRIISKFRFFTRLPKIRIRHKKRGRPRLPMVLPFKTRLKYVFIGSLISFVFIFMPLSTYIFIKNLPSPKGLDQQEIAQTTKIYDRGGTLLYQIYANQNRTVVPLKNIPMDLQNATIAIEDKNFYKTPGIDLIAILRSVKSNLTGEPLQGGSTITQQLIKARLLTPERTIERKIKEIVLALWAEQIYTKGQILEMYLNQVPYGGTAWGAEAAAQTYFGKSVGELNLSESAFLAGLPQAPSVYSPHTQNPNNWRSRQKEVLSRMVELGYITKSQADEAEKQELSLKPPQNSIRAPHFVMFIRDILIEKYGLSMMEKGGLSITTSLDLNIQEMAEKIIVEEVEKSSRYNFSNAAVLITNPKNGDILAMVGGKDYFDKTSGNYNVTTALRQPGSTIKVITYSAALLNGFTAATPIQDSRVTYNSPGSPPYSPVNYDGRFRGLVTLRNALGNSINVPAVKTLNKIGVPAMMDLAEKMGISTWNKPQDYGLALTLGSAEVKMTEMAVVYGIFANQGKKVELNPIIKVLNHRGEVVEEKSEVRQIEILPSEIAFIISDILADNNARIMEFGENSPLKIPKHRVSVKTGTTDNKRDNWTIGFTPDILTAVWVGNNDNSPMNPILASGISGAAPIWNKIMQNLLADSDPKDEIGPIPSNIVIKPCGGRDEFFVKGTENLALCRPLTLKENEQKQTP